jgi:hypothetical protein
MKNNLAAPEITCWLILIPVIGLHYIAAALLPGEDCAIRTRDNPFSGGNQ